VGCFFFLKIGLAEEIFLDGHAQDFFFSRGQNRELSFAPVTFFPPDTLAEDSRPWTYFPFPPFLRAAARILIRRECSPDFLSPLLVCGLLLHVLPLLANFKKCLVVRGK